MVSLRSNIEGLDITIVFMHDPRCDRDMSYIIVEDQVLLMVKAKKRGFGMGHSHDHSWAYTNG